MSSKVIKILKNILPEVHSAGMMQFDPVWASKRHLSSGLEVMHITKGKISLEMNGRRFEAYPGDTLFVPPKTYHRDYFEPTSILEMFHCCLRWKIASLYCKNVTNSKLLSLSLDVKNKVSLMFEQLRADFEGISELDKMVVRSRLLSILVLLLRETNKETNRRKIAKDIAQVRHQDLMEKAKAYIEKNYALPITLDGIAENLKVSPYHLCHVFSMTSEFSLFEYLTRVRIEKARLMLKEGKLSIKEIAERVGYDRPGYFAKVFKKIIGWTPKEYAMQFLLEKHKNKAGQK